MHIQCEQDGALCRMQIVGDMTIYTAAELQQQLLERLVTGEQFAVDLSQVSELDTAGVQQLLLVTREATRLGKVLRWLAPSAAIHAVLGLYHLETSFGASVMTPVPTSEAGMAYETASCEEALP